jgi:hypothetical protein
LAAVVLSLLEGYVALGYELVLCCVIPNLNPIEDWLLFEAIYVSGISCLRIRVEEVVFGCCPMKDAGDIDGEATDALDWGKEKDPLSTELSSSDPMSSNLKNIPLVETLWR